MCLGAASATLLVISTLSMALLTGFPTADASVVAGLPMVVAPQPLTVALTSVTPSVVVPKAAVKIIGSVRNSTRAAITSPVARALLGQRSLNSRDAVSQWAASGSHQPDQPDQPGQPLADVAGTPVAKTLAPGAVAAFTLTIPANLIDRQASFAVLPLRIEVIGTSAATQQSGDIQTFLPVLAAVKAFVPVSIAWLIPLTLDPDPALHGAAGPTRNAAWAKAIGPGSRLERLISGTQNANVTWAIDPAILGPHATPPVVAASGVPSPAPSVTPSSAPGSRASPDPVTASTTALAQQLRAAAPRHTLWALPYADPDLAAILPLPAGTRVLPELISHPSTLDVAVGPARADIAWPVAGTITPLIQTRLASAFASTGLAAAVTSASTQTGDNGSTVDASHKSSGGLPLLAYDDPLSRTVSQTSSKATGALSIQRFLADSMALLGERPGTPNRSVLIAEPRTFAPDPSVLRALFAAVATAKWLIPTTTGQLLAASENLAPESPERRSTGTATSPPASSSAQSKVVDPLGPGTSPLTAAKLAAIPGTVSAISGIASILGDGGLFMESWTDAQVQQLSVRWRDHSGGLTAIDAATVAALSTISRDVRVAPSSVNFFADRGVLQVTVVNDLTVPIHDVHLTLTPAQPRLRIERQPGPLKIAAKSRATVPLQVTSIAAGLVDVEAVLTTRNGTLLGRKASVTVRVQPPASWIYWVMGAMAGVVLVLGTQRSLRRGSTRGSRPEAQEPQLHAGTAAQ